MGTKARTPRARGDDYLRFGCITKVTRTKAGELFERRMEIYAGRGHSKEPNSNETDIGHDGGIVES